MQIIKIVALSVIDRIETVIFYKFDILTPNSGILLHNRGASFTLEKPHLLYEPNKRYAYNSSFLMRISCLSVMEILLTSRAKSFFNNVIDFEMDVQLLDHQSFMMVYFRWKKLNKNIINLLEKSGHKLILLIFPMGWPGLMINQNNILIGGSSSEDGIALGFWAKQLIFFC